MRSGHPLHFRLTTSFTLLVFCGDDKKLGYNQLWLWLLDRELSEGSFNHSAFAKSYGLRECALG